MLVRSPRLGLWIGISLVGCCWIASVHLESYLSCGDPHSSLGWRNREIYAQLLKIILAILALQVVTTDPAPYESRLRQAVNQSQKSHRILQNRQPSSWKRVLSLPSPLSIEMRPSIMQCTHTTCNHRSLSHRFISTQQN